MAAPHQRRRPLDPRTVVLLKQGALGLILLVVIGLFGTGLWYGTRVEFLTLQHVTIDGGETINHDLVRREVETVLDGEYIGLVPRRFAWWYPHAEILSRVTNIPRVKDPMIERVSGTELSVSFAEYIPHALWCAGKGSDDCFFIDSTGFAFTHAPRLEGGAFPRFHTIGTVPALRTQMIPTDDLRSIEILRARISDELALPIAYVETDMMRDVFLGVAGGGEIKATLRMSPEETYENLRTILASPDFSDVAPGNFQYIDLRFGNKVFVNDQVGGPATTTASSSEAQVLPWSDVAEGLAAASTTAVPDANQSASTSDTAAALDE